MPELMTLEAYHQEFGKPRQRAAYTAREADEQIALFQWIETVTSREPRIAWAFHVPNGEYRHKATAVKLKAMGVRPGVPDVFLPVSAHGYVGLAIELKVDGNEPDPEQRRWLQQLREVGWFANVYHGWVAAALAITWYLGRTPVDMGLDQYAL